MSATHEQFGNFPRQSLAELLPDTNESAALFGGMHAFFANKPSGPHNWHDELLYDGGVRHCQVALEGQSCSVTEDFSPKDGSDLFVLDRDAYSDKDVSQLPQELFENTLLYEVGSVMNGQVYYQIFRTAEGRAVIIREETVGYTETAYPADEEDLRMGAIAAQRLDPSMDPVEAAEMAMNITTVELQSAPLTLADEHDRIALFTVLSQAAAAPCDCHQPA